MTNKKKDELLKKLETSLGIKFSDKPPTFEYRNSTGCAYKYKNNAVELVGENYVNISTGEILDITYYDIPQTSEIMHILCSSRNTSKCDTCIHRLIPLTGEECPIPKKYAKGNDFYSPIPE